MDDGEMNFNKRSAEFRCIVIRVDEFMVNVIRREWIDNMSINYFFKHTLATFGNRPISDIES